MSTLDPPPPVQVIDRAALFLDFDGTLVALAARPDAIRVPSGLSPLLGRLAALLGGRVAILTGRAIADLDSHLGTGELAVAGSHGLERRLPGAATRLAHPAPPGLDGARAALRAFAEGDPRLLVEEKPAGVALHYRAAPEREADAIRMAEGVAAQAGLAVQPGKMVVELRAPGAGKGDALRALMTEPPFAGAVPVVVGDDLTDEHAFRAAAALGGFGVLIGAPRDTAATYGLPDVDAVHAWLEAAAPGG